jgi:hypothetical protein
MSSLNSFATLPAEWIVGLAVLTGLVVSVGLYLLVRWWQARSLDEMAEHSILPDTPPGKGSDPYAMGSFWERRRAPRRRGNSVAVEVSDEKQRLGPLAGYILDRSLTGLGLEVSGDIEESIRPGMTLTVRPQSSSGAAPWTRIIVRHCRQQGRRFRLGCEFARQPDSSTMLMFG